MMPSRSTPNLPTTQSKNHTPSIYSYLQNQSGLNFAPVTTAPSRDDDSPPPAPPVRDSSSLKSIKYGPGHEKFPSWPVPAAAEAPQVHRAPPSGGSHRSKSWTDHTNYPKEKVITYTRPYMKRQHSAVQQKLKTVMEKCEKIPPETYESRLKRISNRQLYLPHVDREGKPLGDTEYLVPSPPERDINKPQLTQEELEEYIRSYEDSSKLCSYNEDTKGSLSHLTQAELEEYTKNYEETLNHQHQKQPSYAQSEGYHSYVSSTDSTSTPFLDRLRRDSEVVVSRSQSSTTWDELSEQGHNVVQHEGRDSVVTTSSGSASSSETLKWHGSVSDVSVASSSCTHPTNSSISRQLIAHSARVQTPQKHNSESVLYIGENQGWKQQEMRNNSANKLKLFAINTYTVEPSELQQEQNERLTSLTSPTTTSVADRIHELERQQKFTYLDPEKRHRIPDPTLKAIQKKALLSFYERHHTPSRGSPWRSEPQLARSQPALAPVPQPPPRIRVPHSPSRRASSASDYTSGANSRRSSFCSRDSTRPDGKLIARHQHSNSCGSLSTDLMGPVIVGPAISVDDWIPDKPPERPPKNPHLRNVFPDLFQNERVPSPDLPPPSPPTVIEDEVFNNDEPLPPPPPEINSGNWQSHINERLRETTSNRQLAVPQVETSKSKDVQQRTTEGGSKQTVGIPAGENKVTTPNSNLPLESVFGFPSQRNYVERSSARYPSAQKLSFSGHVAVSQRVVNATSHQYRAEPLRAQQKMPFDADKLILPPLYDRNQRASIAGSPSKDSPPPLQPRQLRINQSMRVRMPEKRPTELSRDSPPRIERRDAKPLNYSLSHSKASYLASRRERERIVPDSDMGVYKRTMSPNGHAIQTAEISDTSNIRKDPSWATKDATILKNNVNIMRRTSMSEKLKNGAVSGLRCDEKESYRKPQLALPDILPVKEKIHPHRLQPATKSPPMKNDSPPNFQKPRSPPKYESPPSSPSKSPSRGSPFAPLRNVSLSSPLRTSPQVDGPTNIISPFTSRSPSSTVSSSPLSSLTPTSQSSPQPSLTLNSPKTSLAPSPRTSPLGANSSTTKSQRTSPMISIATNTPLMNSSSDSPPESPKTFFTSFSSIPPEGKEDTDPPLVVEGLQMMQRTEVILRVNVSTTDAASQTERDELPSTPLPMRKKSQEEIECERLSEDLVKQLPDTDRLKDILVPGPEHKRSTDYVSGLFRPEVTSRPRPTNSPFRSRPSTPREVNTEAPNTTPTQTNKLSDTQPLVVPNVEPLSPLSATSTYFTTSEPKAKFLTRYSQDVNQCAITKDTKDLNKKKTELITRLDKKLEVLRNEQLVISEESRLNDELGENVESHIKKLARPHEAAKFRLHVEEIGKIISLLLSVSGRLARTENALRDVPAEHPEKAILESKQVKLKEQLEEAKLLKECIDKRSVNVSTILYKYLTGEEYGDYDHFINMKAKLIIDSREIADKIKLGEEQLLALKETLTTTD